MTRTSRWRRGRIGIVAVLAIVLGALVPAVSTAGPAVAASDGYMVYPASGNIQSKVGDGCRNNYRAHDGIDISRNGGTPILAAYDGVIKSRTSNGGYGNYVDVQHAGGYVTRYAHMAAPGWFAPGTKVLRGQQIGVVGNTGNSAAYHLHFEVWLNGKVYSQINQGFTCLSDVTRGGTIPLFFPGLGAGSPAGVSAGDFTGDDKVDLLVVAGNGDLRLRAGNGRGGLAGPTTLFGSGWANSRRHITHTDLNGDGNADLLVARSDGVLEYYAGNGRGGFRGAVGLGSGWYSMRHIASGADFTGDGRQDILGVSGSGILRVYHGNGSGGLSAPQTTIGGGWESVHYLIAGDFDGDGRGDIVAVAADGQLLLYTGASGLRTARQVGVGWQEFTEVTGGVDYNGDGRADLLARTPAGQLYLYPGNGNGAFGARVLVASDAADYLAIE
ncbi:MULTISPECIES: VCBS repeat domain-containing M23 family metallopeptidase [Microbacterium]|uniref:VCBS repeat domain-containing M23 family metallopeptidase n=1 Tax=Microbacterium TaxID=33882 RepID=UPI002F266DD7